MADNDAKRRKLYSGQSWNQSRITVHERAALDNMSAMLESGQYCDLIIRCDGHDFNVHKAVMCSASPVIKAAFEHPTKEKASGIIEHKTYDADTIERLINYVYKQTYNTDAHVLAPKKDTTSEQGTGKPVYQEYGPGYYEAASTNVSDTPVAASEEGCNTNELLLQHVNVFAAADYYQIPGLAKLAADNFTAVASRSFQVVGFIDVVTQTCVPCADDALLEALIKISLKHYTELIDCAEFMAGLENNPGVQKFSVAIMKQLLLNQVVDKDAHTARLTQERASKDRMVVWKDNSIKSLNTTIATSKATIKERDASIEKLKGEVKTEQGMSKQLSEKITKQKAQQETKYKELVTKVDEFHKDLGNVRAFCPNRRCDRDFRQLKDLKIERKGETAENGFTNIGWRVKCARCNGKVKN